MRSSHIKLIGIFLISLFSSKGIAEVTEVPFFELPTGQLVLKVELSGIEGEQLFVLEIAGANFLRKDMNYRLHALGIDTLKQSVEFETLNLNGCKLAENNQFRIKKKLGKRNDYVFPNAMLGTIGPAVFKNKVLQVNYNNHILYIADAADELTISDKAQKISFTTSLINPSPIMQVEAVGFGTQLVSLDFSLPISLNLHWSNVEGRAKYWQSTDFNTIQTKIYGENFMVLKHYRFDELYVNREISIYNVGVTFSDKVIACFGHSFLEQMVTTIDFDEGYIYFDPSTEEAEQLFTPPTKKKKKKRNSIRFIG